MPELPEVEHFRSLLIPLVSQSALLQVELVNEKPPRRFLSAEDIQLINTSECQVTEVVRKGKLICMILNPTKIITTKLHLFLHMGMTGRISTPNYVPRLESLKDHVIDDVQGDDAIIPPYTFLKFSAGDAKAFFSDPRKFGAVTLNKVGLVEGGFGELAPDALEFAMLLSHASPTEVNGNVDNSSEVLQGLVGQRTGIKTILLDQKRVMCGVGNWVADEVLYQCHIHPDQAHLTESQADNLVRTLKAILETAIDCLKERRDFPKEWLFHCRWGKRNEGKVKDPKGRMVTFIKSAGRTSAIVPSLQKKTAGAKIGKAKVAPTDNETAQGDGNDAADRKRKEPAKQTVEHDDDDKPPQKKSSVTKKEGAKTKMQKGSVKAVANKSDKVDDLVRIASKRKSRAIPTLDSNDTIQRRTSNLKTDQKISKS